MNQTGFAAAVKQTEGGIYLNVHTQPGAKKEQLRGLHGDAVKIAVHEAAQDGKANQALVAFIAKGLSLSRQQVRIVGGHTSRAKRVFVHGDARVLMRRLEDWMSHA